MSNNHEKYKILKNVFFLNEKKQVIILFMGMVLLSIIETLGVASIVPFMAMVTDSSVIFSNQYLNGIYVQLGFKNVENFLFTSVVSVLVFMAMSNFFTIFMQW